MEGIRALFVGMAASACAVAGAAEAQQQQNLAESEVRSFFKSMEQEAVQAARAGDFKRLIEWTRNNVADEATFSVTNEVYRDDKRMGFAAMTLEKQDMLGFSRAVVGMMSGMDGQLLKDYSPEIEVADVTPIGPNSATVNTEFTETGTLSIPSERATTAAGSTAGDAQALHLEATAQCSHLVHRGEDRNQLVIGLSTCQARTSI